MGDDNLDKVKKKKMSHKVSGNGASELSWVFPELLKWWMLTLFSPKKHHKLYIQMFSNLFSITKFKLQHRTASRGGSQSKRKMFAFMIIPISI